MPRPGLAPAASPQQGLFLSLVLLLCGCQVFAGESSSQQSSILQHSSAASHAEGARPVLPHQLACTQSGACSLVVSGGNAKFHGLDYTALYRDIYQPRGFDTCPDHLGFGWLFLYRQDVDCASLFQALLAGDKQPPPQWPPPRAIPAELRDRFTLSDTVNASEWYWAEQYEGASSPYDWSQGVVDQYIARAARHEEFSYKADTHRVYEALAAYPVVGQAGLVLGSEVPWVEAIALHNGAARVLTIEYHPIAAGHPRLAALHPLDMARRFLNGTAGEWDFAVSFSSVEHSGLGRYGDRPDPDADLADVARLACLVRPGGLLYLGFQVGQDKLVWNAHRIYGPVRLPLLTANWRVVDVFHAAGRLADLAPMWEDPDAPQTMLVLRNARTQPCTPTGSAAGSSGGGSGSAPQLPSGRDGHHAPHSRHASQSRLHAGQRSRN